MDLDPQFDLSFSRRLKAPRDRVWECWTNARHLPHFFVPKPHRVTACTIEPYPGGRFDTTFDVDGAVMENRGTVLEAVTGEKLVFTDAFTSGWKPAADPFMTAIIQLADSDEGGTLYTATARHRSEEACQRHKEMGFFEGWGIVADQLDAYALSLTRG